MPEPPTIFLSYSHADRRWKDRLVEQLDVLRFEKKLDIWDDRRIAAGSNWLPEIETALEKAHAAVLLISAPFLGSEFILNVEVPKLFERRNRDGILVVPLLIKPCAWKKVDWLAPIQCRTVDGKPLSTLPKARADTALADLAGELHDLVTPPSEDIDHLSRQLADAFHREEDLLSRGGDTTLVRAEILDLQRRIREGDPLESGALLAGRFKLLEKIGSGGFSTVWKATDRRRRALVAVKVLHGQYAEDRGRRERFFRGARRMAQLQHHHVVQVTEEKMRDGRHRFFVMEHAEGGDLRRAVLAGELSREEVVRILLEAGEALAFAHEHDLTHRDVKPANILLDGARRAKLTDFDLVRAADSTGGTRTGMLGTFLYAAPELMSRPQDAGVAADVYGLGMTALFAFFGQDLPLDVLRDPAFVSRLDLPAGCREVIERAVAWEPEKRWGSVEELCSALAASFEEVQAPEPAPSTPEPSPTPVASPPRRGSAKPDEALFRWIETPKDGRVELWRRIPEGTGWIGSPKGVGRDNERPRHQVEIVRPFQLLAVPVTNAMYAAFDPKKEWRSWKGVSKEELPLHPIVNVTWKRAVAFCRWLGETFEWARGARLPTEEEWEYACRAGRDTAYWSGEDAKALSEVGWYDANSDNRTHRVGEKLANPWGLYDVHGNVWDWTSTAWDSNRDSGREKSSLTVDPAEEAEFAGHLGARRVLRGGGFASDADWARSACRWSGSPGRGWRYRGFRVLIPFAPERRR